MDEPVNPARHLEDLVERTLAQTLFAVEFARGFTLLEEHLRGARGWLESLPASVPEAALALRGLETLEKAMEHVRTFTEDPRLAELDRGLAAARQAAWTLEEAFAAARAAGPPADGIPGRLLIAPGLERDWQRGWAATVTRHRGESRATFTCRTCGWEFTWVEEVPVGELELPFDDLACPLCHPDEAR